MPVRNSTSSSFHLKLGFMPLLDAAPLIVAQELGFFVEEGLTVELIRESSWATLRDKVTFGILDGAHLLAPMPLATTAGFGSVQKPMLTALSLGLNGNAITLSLPLAESLAGSGQPLHCQHPKNSAIALKVWLDKQPQNVRPLTLAVVHPHSMHHFMLRHWLAVGGIDPDNDVNIVVVPPPMMVSALAQGDIDGFCVGEPYNGLAQRQNYGQIVLTGYDIWQNAPEKVFGVLQSWAAAHHHEHLQLLRALIRACQWLDVPENRSELGALLAHPDYLNIDHETLSLAVQQMSMALSPELPSTHKHFFRYGATFPWHSHASWMLDQLVALGMPTVANPPDLIEQVYRTDLYREAAASLNLPYPALNHKDEQQHYDEWAMGDLILGPDQFWRGQQ